MGHLTAQRRIAVGGSLFFFICLLYQIYSLHVFQKTLEGQQSSTTRTTKFSELLDISSQLYSNLSSSAVALPACPPHPKPNLILGAIDGAKLQDQIFVFMESLELAVGREALEAQRAGACPPTPVVVKILVPRQVLYDLDSGFKTLLRRYPSLDFVGSLPPPRESIPIAITRFQGLADYTKEFSSQYDKILACDLDIAFFRNPFGIPMKPGVELLYFAEWHGLKIGQCSVHRGWFDYCARAPGGPYISQAQHESYKPRDRICAGSVYGTARAIEVYAQTMSEELAATEYECNDQAMHIHIYYSGLLDKRLRQNDIGRVWLVPNNEALFGTVGMTPMVTFNQWGEVLNELGQVQYAVHQYKTHSLLSRIILGRFGQKADVTSVVPAVASLVEQKPSALAAEVDSKEEKKEEEKEEEEKKEEEEHERFLSTTSPEEGLKQFTLAGMSADSCREDASLCSCKYEDCQMHYEYFA